MLVGASTPAQDCMNDFEQSYISFDGFPNLYIIYIYIYI